MLKLDVDRNDTFLNAYVKKENNWVKQHFGSGQRKNGNKIENDLETHFTWRSVRFLGGLMFQRDEVSLLWSVSCRREPANSKKSVQNNSLQKCFEQKYRKISV